MADASWIPETLWNTIDFSTNTETKVIILLIKYIGKYKWRREYHDWNKSIRIGIICGFKEEDDGNSKVLSLCNKKTIKTRRVFSEEEERVEYARECIKKGKNSRSEGGVLTGDWNDPNK